MDAKFRADSWVRNLAEAGWKERQRYNESSPLTVILLSASGHAFALGGEAAARSKEGLRSAKLTARICVAAHKTRWRLGGRPPEIDGVRDLPDFPWTKWCMARGAGPAGSVKVGNFVSTVAAELRTGGVLVY